MEVNCKILRYVNFNLYCPCVSLLVLAYCKSEFDYCFSLIMNNQLRQERNRTSPIGFVCNIDLSLASLFTSLTSGSAQTSNKQQKFQEKLDMDGMSLRSTLRLLFMQKMWSCCIKMLKGQHLLQTNKNQQRTALQNSRVVSEHEF